MRAQLLHLQVSIDGGSRGNPGPAAAAVIISDAEGKILAERVRYLGEATNNVAEWTALEDAVEMLARLARDHGPINAVVRSDSELLVRQFNGSYRIRNRVLQRMALRVREKLAQQPAVHLTLCHVPRAENAAADRAVNRELNRLMNLGKREEGVLRDTVKMVAEFMALAARTAPKAHGHDFLVMRVLSGEEELGRLADAMAAYGREAGKQNFDRDGENVRRSDAVLLIALKNPTTLGLNCGACGNSKCTDLNAVDGPEFRGPVCAWRLVDFGIAVGSAVKTASLFNVDNRIMYRVGVVARRLGLIEGEVVLGIPLSATGKNIFFDRTWPPAAK